MSLSVLSNSNGTVLCNQNRLTFDWQIHFPTLGTRYMVVPSGRQERIEKRYFALTTCIAVVNQKILSNTSSCEYSKNNNNCITLKANELFKMMKQWEMWDIITCPAGYSLSSYKFCAQRSKSPAASMHCAARIHYATAWASNSGAKHLSFEYCHRVIDPTDPGWSRALKPTRKYSLRCTQTREKKSADQLQLLPGSWKRLLTAF